MRLTRLLLRNYRVYEGEHELLLPDGLVGIYGPNGAGKSALVESIRWTLWGQARTPKDEIRTSGVNAECLTEVEFEHEGHLYVVRRTITGVNHTVRAEAHWNGQQVAEGVRDVATYVHSVLGMDDQSFRASVFAEQKQVAAFSAQTPQRRRDLVLRLLGITPLDRARDAARSDARDARADHDRLSGRLPDLDELTDAAGTAATAASAAAEVASTAAAGLADRERAAAEAEDALERVVDLGHTYDGLVAEGKGAAGLVTELTARIEALDNEQASLTDAAGQRDALVASAAEVASLEARVATARRLAELRARAESVVVPAEPAVLDDGPAVAAGERAEAAMAEANALAGQVTGAEAELARARTAAERSASLSPDEDCPVCGQALGTAFEQVQAHRSQEVADAEARLSQATKALATAKKAATKAATTATRLRDELDGATKARSAWEQVAANRAEAEHALALALDEAGAPDGPDGPAADDDLAPLEAALAAARRAADELARLEGRLERAATVHRERTEAVERLGDANGRLEALREKVRSLEYRPSDLEAARTARTQARVELRTATEAAEAARLLVARAAAAAEAATTRLDDARAQHAQLHELADRSRHLGRLADLLADFRNNVVAIVGPRLAVQAAELFAELTDNEYDRLEVDPDTYELQIRDAGTVYGMDRFSGSETDLANLALRVAISEHVRFQSGGAVGLLVLDEVFGPLDEDRKARMLLALERLRSRFRQVLVVTHDAEIKEQLPGAVQVTKLPGRRATAIVVAGI